PAALLPSLGSWDVVIVGGLTRLARDEALAFLRDALERATYALVETPLGPAPGTPALVTSGRASVWELDDFRALALVREATFHDVDGRFGSFVLSRRDPRDVRGSLFPAAEYDHLAVTGTDAGELEGVLERVAEMALELGYRKRSAVHRLADGVRTS